MAKGGIDIGGRRIERVIAVVNTASGRAGPDAPQQVAAILRGAGLDPEIQAPDPSALQATLQKAVDDRPDLLVVVAGDGTARTAASICHEKGPLLAPLPGGTMNMLPRALYGERDWPTALKEALDHGIIRSMSGGRIDNEDFYVAAILGSPALWARAREAIRHGQLRLAIQRARGALHRAFTGRLRYQLEHARPESAEALTLITPLISRALAADEPALEAASLDPAGALDVFRLAASYVAGSWRQDPAVTTRRCRSARAWAAGRIPAVLDGETVRLGRSAKIQFRPTAFRALALDLTEPTEAPA